MSEPMTSAEIEDVLSSIRRLVSEELRSAPQIATVESDRRAGGEAERHSPMIRRAAAKALPEKLLLTPALRVIAERPAADVPSDDPAEVDPAEVELADSIAAAAEDIAADIAAAAELPSTLGARVSVLGAAVEARGNWDGEPDAGASPVPEAAFWTDEAVDDESWTPEEPAPAVADVLRSASFVAFPRLHLSSVQRAEPIAADAAGDAAPSGAASSAADAAPELAGNTAAEGVAEEGGGTTAALVLEPAVEPQLEEEAVPGWAQQAPEDLAASEASVAGLEQALDEAIDQAEPAFGMAGPAAVEDWIAASDTDALATVGDALQGVDEEMLRDMVRELIREELQGPLGERITRNIRKLVRVEIARALTLRDLG